MNHSDFTSLDDGEVAACPGCDSASIEVRTPSNMRTNGDDTYRYYCPDCGTGYDEYVTRERRRGSYVSGMAKRLSDADPDEVCGDD